MRVVVSGNQIPVTVDITDEAMQHGSEVYCSALRTSRQPQASICVICSGVFAFWHWVWPAQPSEMSMNGNEQSELLQALSNMVLDAMKEAHSRSVEVWYPAFKGLNSLTHSQHVMAKGS